MGDTGQKGDIHADIPSSAVEDALRSVERRAKESASAGGGAEVAVEVEAATPAPSAAEVESLKAQLELSQAKGRELLEKLKDEHERLLRAAADLENYKKRAQKERDELQRFGVEKLVKDLLPVVDNLDRALAAAPAGDPLVDGVKLVRASLEQALTRYGVKAFSALGQPFDPALHEALLQMPSPEKAPGTVVLEHARGFTLHDRLLRPAMVGVAVAPAEGPAAAREEAGAKDGSGSESA